jgi:hypothetical protein
MTPQERAAAIARLEAFPAELEAAVAGLSAADLTTAYKAGEWTVAQNVHHVADAHTAAYFRCRQVLTQDSPAASGYDPDAFAALPDASSADLSGSLALIHGMHTRWAAFFRNLRDEDYARASMHPTRGPLTLDWVLEIYSNHGPKHLIQMRECLEAKPA